MLVFLSSYDQMPVLRDVWQGLEWNCVQKRNFPDEDDGPILTLNPPPGLLSKFRWSVPTGPDLRVSLSCIAVV